MRFEKTQKGNPHELTINQHIFPAKSIERFIDKNGFVDVYLKSELKRIKLSPKNNFFCTKRSWDQKAESGYMKDIEISFQSLVSKIVSGHIFSLSENENRIILAFFSLWRQRYFRHVNPIEDTELIGIHPGNGIIKDEEEILEKKGVMFAKKEDCKSIVPGRFMNSVNILSSIDNEMYKYNTIKWGVVKSLEGEFIVPDTFSDNAIVPITPKIILLGQSENLVVKKAEVMKVNRLAILMSKKYYFGKDLSNCPE